ncbi:PapC/FimD family outer membrane usher protein [Salmonella enterica subsp. enterica]|uniref:fimbria/pilus outer membrane usher protein n=1 Tax=Salmonella enterica TaxID=28901 RepID=UPI00107B5A43|nr:fimbria/pilus outer membrane usher protein [Salmonella enterica]EAB6708044.1 PapC/FimD family outer membrane usher protein [Salmonella enterica subsp. enterica serovar Brandenburg]EBG6822385.1 PapC/FimD family outer membrane usher protein [Salmonella enterica subsp. enterica]EBY2673365.1 PapC/FimD family outer membrane usher protein [Salmonella enterica subsp. enterica serovar Schwarzengrund]EGP2908405.1 fimbria/pilus outer membrane usher protein [Salmonella enterica subsp. enterica serovar 
MLQGQFSINRIAFVIALILLSGHSLAVEFNTDVVDTEDKSNINFSAFSRSDYIMPGTYQMQIRLNGDSLGNDIPVPFYERSSVSGEKLPEACLSPSVVEKLGLTDASRKKVGTWHKGECADFRGLPGAVLSPDLGQSVLALNIPQAWLEYSDASWLPPSRWDNGIPGVLLDYNANGTVTHSRHGGQTQYAAINGTAGLNAGAWRLRADYQGSYSHQTGSRISAQKTLDLSRVYLYRPLPKMQARLTLGESYVNSSVFDSWRYTGGVLESDENMLPPQLRGYAPEIIGSAKTNARVTVTQQGRVLYDSTVPAGPFRIQSLSDAARGQLDVKVTEQDGEVRTFTVSTASVPYLTRPGRVRYQMIVGRPSNWDHRMEGDVFVGGDASWGISNAWSLYGGSILSKKYKSLALGVGRDLMQFGTLALDITQSFARLSGAQITDEEDRKGKSWRVSYSKRFDDLNADVTFAGYRFSEREFMTMQQYLDARNRGHISNQQKERYQVTLNKRFDDIGLPLSVGLNYEHQTYWDRGDTEQYGVNVGTWFDLPALGLHNASLSLTANRSQYYGRNDDTINLMLSVPLGNGSLSMTGAYSGGRYSERVGYYGRVGQVDSYSLNAGVNHGGAQSDSQSFSGMYTHTGRLAQVSGNMAVEGNRYTSAGFSINGGLTATANGAALHAGGYNGSTRLMVDTDGVGGVPVDGGRVITNPWGIGVVTDMSSYYRNTTRVDVNNLPEDVEAKNGVVETALTEGAIGYRKFSVLKGERLFAVLRLADGSHPPFGANVRNKQGHELGIVSDGGLAWLSGVNPGESLDVAWDERVRCRVQIPEKIGDAQLLLPCPLIAGQ